MDPLKSSFEKIFEQFTETNGEIQKDKSNIDILTTSAHEDIEKFGQLHKKRKLSLERNESTVNSTFKDFSCNASTSSNYSANMSVWEQRRMKGDLLEAETRISNLKNELDRQQKLYAEREVMLEDKISNLKRENDSNAEKVEELQRHLNNIRKRERKYKDEKLKAEEQLTEIKLDLEEKIDKLEKENGDLRIHFQTVQSDLTNELSKLQMTVHELETEIKTKTAQLMELQQYKVDIAPKVENFKIIEDSLEQEKFKTHQLQNKVMMLENEIASYGEYKSLSETFHEKMRKYCEFEQENERLTRTNQRLHDLITNQLLMEEKINNLKTQLKNYNKEHAELVELRVKYKESENTVKSWIDLGKYFLPNEEEVPTPDSLRDKFESILNKDLELLNESSTAKTEKSIIEVQKDELQSRYELLKKQNDDCQRGLKHHQTILSRLQKKLQLVVRERDAFKQLLDNYEKDLTISATASSSNNGNLRFKLETLEKSVADYKELCAKMESELEAAKSMPDLAQISLYGNEHYNAMKRELDDIRVENDRLRRRKDEIELELETKNLRNALLGEPTPTIPPTESAPMEVDDPTGTTTTTGQGITRRILHFVDNPADDARKTHVVQVEKLQAEIQLLREKIRKLEEGNAELTMRLQDESMVTANIKERETLQKKLTSLENKNYHLKEVYKTMSQEFREVCYMLFGYRVDRIGNKNYRISSMYAESVDDYLSFRLNDEGALDMLETDYSEQLSDMMGTHLAAHNSLPAFLSSLTLELFKRTTICL